MTTSNATHALALLHSAVAELGSKQAVADRLNVSRCAISLAMAGKYKGDPSLIFARAIALFDGIDCPYLAEKITTVQCRQHCTGEPPVQNPAAMRHYRACQSCPQCPRGAT